MQEFNKHYLFAILLLLKATLLFAMDEAPKEPNYQPIASLKNIAAETIISQLMHDSELLKKVNNPKQFPSELHDFIKSKIHRDHNSLLLKLLPYKHKTLVGHQGPVTAVCLSDNCDYALTGSKDNTIRLWDLNEGTCIKIFEGHSAKITALAFDKEERIFASGSKDGNVRIWDIQTGNCIHNIEDFMLKDLKFQWPCRIRDIVFYEKFLLLKNNAMTGIWNFSEAKIRGAVRNIASDSKDKKLCIHANVNNRAALFASGPETHIIEQDSGKIICTLLEHPGRVMCGKISPNEKLAITGSTTFVAKLWDIPTGKCLHTFSEQTAMVTAVTFSNDNTKAFTATKFGGKIQLKTWDVETGQLLDERPCQINKVPLAIIIHNNNDYYLTFSNGTGCIITEDRSALMVNKRIFIDKSFSLITLQDGNGAIFSPNHRTAVILDFGKKNSIAFDLKYNNNLATALFGLDTNDCQLWTLFNDLSLDQLIFILQLEEKRKLDQSIEYDNQMLESFDPQQQIRLKEYFELD